MDVQAVGASGRQHMLCAASQCEPLASKKHQVHPQANAAAAKPSTVPVDVPTSPSGTDAEDPGESAQGVLRLLEAGHFHGVADVRLRINFFDRLSAKAAGDAQQAAQTGAASLVNGVGTRLDELRKP